MKTVARHILCVLMILGMASALCAQVTNARESMNLGVSAFRASNFAAAAEYFARAKQLDPALTSADLYLATTYAQMYVPGVQTVENQDFGKKSIALFESYLAKEPASADALAGLAGIYQNTQDMPKARDIYLRLTKVAPQNPTSFYSVGAIDWMLSANRVAPLPEAERARLISEGLDNLDIALRLNPQYDDAMTYKNLLLRAKAGMTTNPADAARLTDEADQLFSRALAIRGMFQAAGAVGGRAGAPPLPPPPPPPPPPPGTSPTGQLTRVGGDVAQRNLITQVPPQYPALARAARVQDYVMMQATIDKAGTVADLKILHGHPLLNDAAVEAVRQWRYAPILLNGQPTDVVTTITVNFSFQ